MTTHLWLYLAIIAYFIEAVVFMIDKYLLSSKISASISYAFYAAILSAFAVVLIPLGVTLPNFFDLMVALASGAFFFVALVYLYHSIKEIDVLEATPAISAISAVTTILLNLLLIHELLSRQSLLAFLLLVIGTLMMSYLHLENFRVLKNMFLAGLAFGASFVTLKYFFNSTNFIDGLFWTRMGLVISALVVLTSVKNRRLIFGSLRNAPESSQMLFMSNKLLSAVAFVTLYYAIKIGSVVFVNALQGFQYVFTLLLSIILARRIPRLFERGHHDLWRKIIATFFIAAGFFLLSVHLFN